MKSLLVLTMIVGAGAFAKTSVLKPAGKGSFLLPETFMVSELAKDYAKVFGKNLSMPEDFKDKKTRVFGPKKISEDKVFKLLSFVFYDAGYTLNMDPLTSTVEVMAARDVRYSAVPTYKDIDQVPNDLNHVRFVYGMRHIDGGDLARNLRPFMSRYGRVVDGPEGKSLVIMDTGKNIHRIWDFLKIVDTEEFADSKRKVDEMNAQASVVVKKKKSFLDVVADQHILFIAAFSLIFGIAGFILRGYAIKRIEGGW